MLDKVFCRCSRHCHGVAHCGVVVVVVVAAFAVVASLAAPAEYLLVYQTRGGGSRLGGRVERCHHDPVWRITRKNTFILLTLVCIFRRRLSRLCFFVFVCSGLPPPPLPVSHGERTASSLPDIGRTRAFRDDPSAPGPHPRLCVFPLVFDQSQQLVYYSFVLALFRTSMWSVLRAYGHLAEQCRESGDYRMVMSQIMHDYLFRCPNLRAAQLIQARWCTQAVGS